MSRYSNRFLVLGTAVALATAAVHAHTYVGLEHGALAGARVQSPTASPTDLPVPLPGSDLSVVCFLVRNTSPFDSRITAVGLELPGAPTGFALVSPADGDFHLVEQVSNVPGLEGVTLDFALITGKTFGGGRPHAGLPPSATSTTFCVSGPFNRDLPIEQLLNGGVLRMQRVGGEADLGDVSVWSNRPR